MACTCLQCLVCLTEMACAGPRHAYIVLRQPCCCIHGQRRYRPELSGLPREYQRFGRQSDRHTAHGSPASQSSGGCDGCVQRRNAHVWRPLSSEHRMVSWAHCAGGKAQKTRRGQGTWLDMLIAQKEQSGGGGRREAATKGSTGAAHSRRPGLPCSVLCSSCAGLLQQLCRVAESGCCQRRRHSKTARAIQVQRGLHKCSQAAGAHEGPRVVAMWLRLRESVSIA